METTSLILKKPWFKKSETFFREIYHKYQGRDIRDSEGNTLAHLCIYHGQCHYIEELSSFFDIKNKEGVTPRDLMRYLGIDRDSQNHLGGMHVYKTQVRTIDFIERPGIKTHFQIDYLNHLEFLSSKELMWTFHRCKKYLKEHAIKRRNHWIDSLYGESFFRKKVPKTYIKWINPLIGYGLFAMEDIPQYSFIGEYTGIVRKRQWRLDKYNDYIFGYVVADNNTPFVIDAHQKGNYTRFINHSDEPNLYSTWIIVKNVCHIILVTKKHIPKETQLTYDYGPVYWKKRTEPLTL